MKPEKVKEFLAWSIPCLTSNEVYSEEKQDYINKIWPLIGNDALKGLRTGVVREEVLKAWYKAYPYVKELDRKGFEHPMKEYMFNKHNFLVMNIYKIDKKILPCLALVGKVIKKKDNKILVDVLGKKKELVNRCNASIDDYVGVHIGNAVEIISMEEFKKYNELIRKYNEFI